MLFMGKLERGREATNLRRYNLVLAASSLPSFFQAPLVPAKRGEGGGGKQQLFLATPFNSTAEGGGRGNGGGEVSKMRDLENAGQRGGRNCDGALRCTARRVGGGLKCQTKEVLPRFVLFFLAPSAA